MFQKKSFDEFVAGGIVVRLRTENNNTVFTLKQSLNKQGDSTEIEYSVGDAGLAQDGLITMGYNHILTIEKNRIQTQDGAFMIALDSVSKLGDFLEIEVLAKELSQELEHQIMEKATNFAIDSTALESRKYDFLLSNLRYL